MAMDPVCGMKVDEATAKWSLEHEGKSYYFCSPGCMTAFQDDPHSYIGGSADRDAHEHHHS